ncbi:MAG: hypothetical protein COT71_00955 [Candidatus Andersenbacteria bacterium CG10_big_fil_rev_8_21_14_0_10_54_11]|uniref:histidine kinase n=1 Tax=Candidatus Andersenbacteria bacterium CG10_big_fil_rev_8_21_14_0_10_54_11 TaxID=1974485 RepID=A0A2M6X042_9BACT|nr:MAG: hypothetical protein COT71_00955 [Candidatus Andersenbacteria bacterium CG10_big_fil_rev_8_21_14_0_10_54_11]
MLAPSTHRLVRAALYGGVSVILALDVYFLFRAAVISNFVPILPIIVSILAAGGLLLLTYAERRAKKEDARDHRRISRVAHQLTAPVAQLQDDLNRLLRDADKLPAEARLQIKQMETKANILLTNIRDVFLTLQALEGAIAQNIRRYDLCPLLAEAVDRARPLASARNVELIYHAHCEHAPVRLDRQLFFIVIAHVLENAMTYTLKPGLVNVAVTKGKNRVRVIIQDRGIGIKPSEASLVEHPFARGEEAARYDPDGIGLGVALSKLIVQECNGQLTWKSRRDHLGTQFEITLPLMKGG